MEYTPLGDSGINVSRICMGCMGFGDKNSGMHGWVLDEENSREIIKRGIELGVNFFDTASAYQGGTSERYLGRAIKDFARREDMVIATKYLPRTEAQIESGISVKGNIDAILNQSLKNLDTDYVDLYICHKWDSSAPIEETMEALNDVIRAGKARAIGISNCFAWQIATANSVAANHGWAKFVSVQGHYNLIFREEEREMAPYCHSANVAMTPYSPLAAGRLSRNRTETSNRLNSDAYAKSKYDATAEQDGIIIDRVSEIAQRRGISPTQVSLGWLLTKVTAPVVGTTKISHIEGAIKAVEVKLSDEELAYLEEPYFPHKLVGMMSSTK